MDNHRSRSEEDLRQVATCAFCPPDFACRRMLVYHLRGHTALAHVINNAKPLVQHHCDGHGIYGENGNCWPDQVYRNSCPNSYVDHMTKDHPHQVQNIPFNIRYKAALSDFMTELSIFSSNAPTPDEIHRRNQVIGHVLDPENPLPALYDEGFENVENVVVKEERADSPEPGPDATENMATDDATEEMGDQADAEDCSVDTENQEIAGTVNEEDESDESMEQSQTEVASPVASGGNTRDTDEEDGSVEFGDSGIKTPTTPGGRSKISLKGLPRRPPQLLSKEYKEALCKLNNRAAKNAKSTFGGRPSAACHMPGCNKVIMSSGQKNTLVLHAMTHMVHFAYACKVCDYGSHTYTTWYQHFNNRHSDLRLNMVAGDSLTDYYEDKRKELEQEIVQMMVECYKL